MEKEKIKIAFEIGNVSGQDEKDIWVNKGDYRQVLRELELNGENEMFIVTKCTNQEFVDNVATYLTIPRENIYVCGDNITVLSILGQIKASIYLTNEVEIVNLGNTNTNELACILVDYKPEAYSLEGKWAKLLSFWISRRLNNRKSE